MILREASSHRSALRRTWHACPARHTDSPRHDSCFAAAPQNQRNRTITKTNQTTKPSAAPHNACTRPRVPSSVGGTRESPTAEAASETTVLPERRDRRFWESLEDQLRRERGVRGKSERWFPTLRASRERDGKVRCPVSESGDSGGNANGNDGNDGKGRSRMVRPMWTDRSTAPRRCQGSKG